MIDLPPHRRAKLKRMLHGTTAREVTGRGGQVWSLHWRPASPGVGFSASSVPPAAGVVGHLYVVRPDGSWVSQVDPFGVRSSEQFATLGDEVLREWLEGELGGKA
ncbi:MAG: hypothetical protein WEA09_02280 [Gemmatimonadota bacterium]